MTYTILTTHTLGGEIEIGFHRKADGTAYAFADVADSRWQEGFWEARSGSVLMTPDEALLVAGALIEAARTCNRLNKQEEQE